MAKRIKGVKLEQNPYEKDKFMLMLNFEDLPLAGTAGSYNVLYARLLGFDYVTYLRFCRDVLHADIRGKGQLYPTVLFERNKETLAFVDMLNSYINLALFDKEHPNLQEMKDVIENEGPIQEAKEREAFERFKSEIVNLIFD